jgi:D-xylose transport system substrate-binding protein
MKKIGIIFMALILTVTMVGTAFARSKKKKAIKVGLSFSDFETERWPVEADILKKLYEDEGCKVIVQVANHDTKLQNDQIDNMVTQGCDVLVIIAEDGAAAATAVDKAAAEGVHVIAYDRLIKSPNLACYISFDNVEVGRTQAKGVVAAKDSGNFVLLGGNPTDNNAVLVRKGQMEILKPYIDSGKVKVVADQWVENWSPAIATSKMENILTAQANKIDAVVASNDGTALGALQAMKAQGLAGKVPISGQDATYAGCNSIIKGELTVTVMKDTRLLAPLCVSLSLDLVNGKKISGMTSYSLKELTGQNLAGNVPCKFLPVTMITKDNVHKEVVVSGFQSYDDVYKDIPADKRPARP